MDIQLTEPAVKHMYIYIYFDFIVLHSSLFMKHISQYIQIIVYTQYILSFVLYIKWLSLYILWTCIRYVVCFKYNTNSTLFFPVHLTISAVPVCNSSTNLCCLIAVTSVRRGVWFISRQAKSTASIVPPSPSLLHTLELSCKMQAKQAKRIVLAVESLPMSNL